MSNQVDTYLYEDINPLTNENEFFIVINNSKRQITEKEYYNYSYLFTTKKKKVKLTTKEIQLKLNIDDII